MRTRIKPIVEGVFKRHYELAETPWRCACGLDWPCLDTEKLLAEEIVLLEEFIKTQHKAFTRLFDKSGMSTLSRLE